MYKNQLIKRGIAAVMLLLFAFSITPKQLLHDVITNHKHYVLYHVPASVSTAKYQCNWQEQPVESPFVDQSPFLLETELIVHFSYTPHYIPGYFSAQRLVTSLRGPPARIS